MIDALNFETAHRYGDALPALLRCRYKEFVARQKYDVPVYNGMEYDQYDTPAAVYLTWKDGQGAVRAGIRILPTARPYMIQELWPQTVQYMPMPCARDFWEVTRFFIDRSLDPVVRQQAHGEILCALLEFALHHDIARYIGIAPPKLWVHTFRKCGWPANPAGDVVDIGFSEKVQACVMDVSRATLENVRATMKVSRAVISCMEILLA